MAEPGERKLTQKMRAWTLLTFKTNEPTESYMEIYQCKKERVAAACASRLLTKANVQALMVELRQKAVDDSIMTVQERQQRLSEFGREDVVSPKGTLIRHGSIAAIAELNKMGGNYAPQKMEHTGKDGGPLEVQVDARAKIIGLISRYATGTRDERDNPELDRPRG